MRELALVSVDSGDGTGTFVASIMFRNGCPMSSCATDPVLLVTLGLLCGKTLRTGRDIDIGSVDGIEDTLYEGKMRDRPGIQFTCSSGPWSAALSGFLPCSSTAGG